MPQLNQFNQLNQHNQTHESVNAYQTGTRIPTLSSQRSHIPLNVTCQSRIYSAPPPSTLFQNCPMNCDNVEQSATVTNQWSPPTYSGNDSTSNNTRIRNSYGISNAQRIASQRKYTETDIVSEMNRIFKHSMFMRGADTAEDESNAFTSGTQPQRETMFNRLGKFEKNYFIAFEIV